jgi:RHS family protein (fragment)
MRYYEPEAGRFVNQDPIGLLGGANLYWFAPNSQIWVDALGLTPIDGGSYSAVRKSRKGGEVNHMPASQALQNGGGSISRDNAPSIWMETNDHRKTKDNLNGTASWGRWKEADRWRSHQAELIRKGKVGKAMEMDIRDIKRKFGKKYNQGLIEMIDYAIKNEYINRKEGRRLKRKYTKC